ncbi:MAG: four helix bundle protein [Saprospiraceae bacterium]
MEQRKYNLEERLINYTCSMIDIDETLPNSRAGNYIAGQLIRSCHSPTFNYAEVQGAESRKDFIHKMAIVLKELKECRVALKIIIKKNLINYSSISETSLGETEELIAIVAKSIITAESNKRI